MSTKLKTKPEITREKADFSKTTIFCGIDVHKKRWSVTIYLEDRFINTFSQPSGAEILVSHLRNNYPNGNYVACYESGFCGFSVQRELSALGVSCMVVNAADVPTTNKASLNKTDAVDSKRLAEALAKGMISPIYIPSAEGEGDRSLVRYRRKMISILSGKKRSIKSSLFTLGIRIPAQFDNSRWTNIFINWVKNLPVDNHYAKVTMDLLLEDVIYMRKQLLRTNKAIKSMSQSEKYKKMFDTVCSAPGIGLITAMTLLTEVGDIKRFDSFTKFNSYIGLCPSQFSSGEKIHMGQITTRNNKAIRPLMIEAAWVAVRLDPAMALKFSELIRTKTKKRAIIVIARKLLSRIYSIWTKEQTYDRGLV